MVGKERKEKERGDGHLGGVGILMVGEPHWVVCLGDCWMV